LIEQERGEGDEECDQDGFGVLHEQHDEREEREEREDSPIRLTVRVNLPRRTDSPAIAAMTSTIASAHAFPRETTSRSASPTSRRLIDTAAQTSAAWVETHPCPGHRYRGVADVRPGVASLPVLERPGASP
jgi:hypothetical protein